MLTHDIEKDWLNSRGINMSIEWTEQELRWLEERSKPEYPAACVRNILKVWDIEQSDCLFCGSHKGSVPKRCPLASDYKDAAEFEARVAIILAKSPCFECQEKRKYGPNALSCIEKLTREGAEACRLKQARIRAEQEMEAEQ